MTYKLIKKGHPSSKKVLFALLLFFAIIISIILIGGYFYLAIALNNLSLVNAIMKKEFLFLVTMCVLMIGTTSDKYLKYKRIGLEVHGILQIESQRLVYNSQTIPAKAIDQLMYQNAREFSTIFIVKHSEKQFIQIDYSPEFSDDFLEILSKWCEEQHILFEEKMI